MIHHFKTAIVAENQPARFTSYKLGDVVDPYTLEAIAVVQNYLSCQQDWEHNFGLSEGSKLPIIGKMFGVLVVKSLNNNLGFLAAFSGKMAGVNRLPYFVPPVYDSLEEGGFLSPGMNQLKFLSNKMKLLEDEGSLVNQSEIKLLKERRKALSVKLQNQLYSSYFFRNKAGEEKGLVELFAKYNYKNPPSAAGECAGPKLLQYAFKNNLQPLSLVEFWWGKSPKSKQWLHKNFYPCCKEKCEPILDHMLNGITTQ